jgi:DNA-binding FadR family transcriptional regulator
MKRQNVFQTEYAVDRVERDLLRRIINGQFKAGEFLPSIQELAVSYGLSETTVRSAAGRLVSRGFLTDVPGHGLRCDELLHTCDIKMLIDIIEEASERERSLELEVQLLDALSIVFLEVAYRAAACRTEDHLKWFSHYLHCLSDGLNSGRQPAKVADAHFQLFRVMAAAGGSVAFTVLLNAFRDYLIGPCGLALVPEATWLQFGKALELKQSLEARQILQRAFDIRMADTLSWLDELRVERTVPPELSSDRTSADEL